jgi:hypothetical protein
MATPEQWSPIFDIGSVNTSAGQLTSATVLRDGWIVVTWLSPATSQTKYRVFNSDGTAFASEVVVTGSHEKSEEQPNVAALSNGYFMVTFDDHDLNTTSRALLLNTYDVFTGLVKSSFIKNSETPFGSVIAPFNDLSYNITYNNYVDGIEYYHHAAPSGSDTSHYGEVDGNYRFEVFGAGAVSVD